MTLVLRHLDLNSGFKSTNNNNGAPIHFLVNNVLILGVQLIPSYKWEYLGEYVFILK
jgi:hypothetical protein